MSKLEKSKAVLRQARVERLANYLPADGGNGPVWIQGTRKGGPMHVDSRALIVTLANRVPREAVPKLIEHVRRVQARLEQRRAESKTRR